MYFFFFKYLEEEENKVEALCKLQSKIGFILPPFPVRFFFFFYLYALSLVVLFFISLLNINIDTDDRKTLLKKKNK